MKYWDILDQITKLYDAEFARCYDVDFAVHALIQNCFCPILKPPFINNFVPAKADVRQAVLSYYNILNQLLGSIIRNDPVTLVIHLSKIKTQLLNYGVSLTDFCCSCGFYHEIVPFSNKIFYTQTDDQHSDEPYIFSIYISEYWLQDERSPELFKKLKFKCFSDNPLNYSIYSIIKTYCDKETLELIKKNKWDEINFTELESYIEFNFKDEQLKKQSEVQQVISEQQKQPDTPDSKDAQNEQEIAWQEIRKVTDDWIRRPFKQLDFDATIRGIHNFFDLERHKEIGSQNFEELKKILRKQTPEITLEENKFLEESYDKWSAIIERAEELGQKGKFDGLLPIIIRKLEDSGKLPVMQEISDEYIAEWDDKFKAAECEFIDSFIDLVESPEHKTAELQTIAIKIHQRINEYCLKVKNYRLICEQKDLNNVGDFYVIAEKFENGELFVNRVDIVPRKSILTMGLEKNVPFVAVVVGVNKEQKSLRLRFVPETDVNRFSITNSEIVIVLNDTAKEIHFLEYVLKCKGALMHAMGKLGKPYLFGETLSTEIEEILYCKKQIVQGDNVPHGILNQPPEVDEKINIYTFKAFQTKVGIKMTPKGFQDRLKKSPFWNKDVFPASTGQRITKIKCKPSFIETYRRHITPNVN